MEVGAELFDGSARGCWRRSTAAGRPRPWRSCSRSACPTSTRRWRGARRPARPRRGRSATSRRSSSSDHHDAIAAEVALRPDVTLEELRAWLLATHGVTASLGLMHKTLARLGLTLKKVGAGRRAGPARRRRAAGRLARQAERDEPGAAGVRRRDRGRHQHGPALRPQPARQAPGRPDPARPLEEDHFRRWPYHVWLRRPLRLRRCHERHDLPRLDRADAGTSAGAGRPAPRRFAVRPW